MSASIYPKPDGLSASLQFNGTDALVFNAGGTNDVLYDGECTQTGGALTFTMPACVVKFRSTTATTGAGTVVSGTPADLVLPSGGTLGSVTTVSARIVRVIINNAGTLEQAIVNISGGNDLSETGTINTTAIGTGSDSANVFYSTTARTGVAYKVVGIVDAVNTAGAWGNPTLVQGAGGQAVTAMSSFGYGQTWQNVTGSRAAATTYYNTTGKAILVMASGQVTGISAHSAEPTVAGLALPFARTYSNGAAQTKSVAVFTVPPGNSYSVAFTACAYEYWYELR